MGRLDKVFILELEALTNTHVIFYYNLRVFCRIEVGHYMFKHFLYLLTYYQNFIQLFTDEQELYNPSFMH